MSRMIFFLLMILWLTACGSQTPEPDGPIGNLVEPKKVPVIAKNQWRLAEVVYDGEHGTFDSIEPVLVTFHPGLVAMQACNSASLVFDTENGDTVDEYRLIQGEGTARLCENGGSEQEWFISQAMMAADRYKVVEDTLIFSGDNTQLTFVIDNKARKPLDWQ